MRGKALICITMLTLTAGCSLFPAPTPAATGSINGWLWHDLCDSGQDGEPPLTSAPAGCIASPSPLGDYRADGVMVSAP